MIILSSYLAGNSFISFYRLLGLILWCTSCWINIRKWVPACWTSFPTLKNSTQGLKTSRKLPLIWSQISVLNIHLMDQWLNLVENRTQVFISCNCRNLKFLIEAYNLLFVSRNTNVYEVITFKKPFSFFFIETKFCKCNMLYLYSNNVDFH